MDEKRLKEIRDGCRELVYGPYWFQQAARDLLAHCDQLTERIAAMEMTSLRPIRRMRGPTQENRKKKIAATGVDRDDL